MDKIVDLCKEKGISLILTKTPGVGNIGWYNYVSQYTDENSIRYIDYNEADLYQELNYDLAKNNDSIAHLNLSGSEKVSSHMGKVLSEEYGVGNIYDAQYEEYIIPYHFEELKYVTDFNEYLTKINDDDFTVFIAIMDEGTDALDETSLGLLRELGLTSDFTDAWCYSYYAVISQDGVIECLSPDNLEYTGTIDSTPYTIYSEGTDTGSCSIKIDGTEYAVNSRGMNFVVMRNDTGEVIDSVCFDTYSDLAAKR